LVGRCSFGTTWEAPERGAERATETDPKSAAKGPFCTDEFSSDPGAIGVKPRVHIWVRAGAFLYGRLLSGVGGGVRNVLVKAHWIKETVGRERKESSAGSDLMVNV
jgi:hypothetical protein